MRVTPFNTIKKLILLSKRHFTPFKSIASISNEIDPDGKNKIITILNIKLPHRNGIDNLKVKVDDGAEANILPLDYFRTMFPHALDGQGYPKDGFLRGSRTNLECYNDGRLVNHGIIKLRLQHYLDKPFQDHYFYVVKTKTSKKIVIGHAASTRLGLICVLCKNVSKSVSAIENKTNTSSRDSFQDHCLKIYGKTQLRNQRVGSKSFQDHPSNSFKTMAKCTCTKTLFKTPAKGTQGSRGQDRHKLTPFKTISVDGIRVIREKDNVNRVRDTVKNIDRETSFKTMGKSGKKKFPSRTQNMRSVRHFLSRPLVKMAPKVFLSRPLIKVAPNKFLSRPLIKVALIEFLSRPWRKQTTN